MSSDRPDVAELLGLLRQAEALVGQGRTSLRVDAENLETVYLDAEGDAVIVHDQGQTFYYLAVTGPQSADEAFLPWSAALAADAISKSPVALINDSDEKSQAYRLVLPLAPAMMVKDAVSAMAEAIDRVFEAHTVEHLRRSWSDD